MITDEMIEAGAEAIKLRITECFGVSVPKELAQACLEAALQTKLTEADKLLEVMGYSLEVANRCIESGDLILVGSAYHSMIKQDLAQYQSYKAGRE